MRNLNSGKSYDTGKNEEYLKWAVLRILYVLIQIVSSCWNATGQNFNITKSNCWKQAMVSTIKVILMAEIFEMQMKISIYKSIFHKI